CTHGMLPESICCSSIGKTTRGPLASFRFIHSSTAPITIGTYSFPALRQGSFMHIGSMDHSIPPEGCALTRPRFCSIRMDVESLFPKTTLREAAEEKGDNSGVAMKSVIVDTRRYDWEGDVPLRRPSSQTIVYEMHVKGFTRHPSSGVSEGARGSYLGLIEKIPYLSD